MIMFTSEGKVFISQREEFLPSRPENLHQIGYFPPPRNEVAVVIARKYAEIPWTNPHPQDTQEKE